MKNPKIYTLFLLLFVAIIEWNQEVTAQNAVYFAKPESTSIEISGKEPKPDIIPELFFAAGGGGTYNPVRRYVEESISPYISVWRGSSYLSVCNLPSGENPQAMVTFPSGKKKLVVGHPPSKDELLPCWSFDAVRWESGMEFGIYSFNVTYSQGSLSANWAVDYPYCRTVLTLDRSDTTVSFWFVGFNPGETANVYFFTGKNDGIDPTSQYITSRQVRIGSDGSLVVNVSVARSAEFTASQIYLLVTMDTDISYSDLLITSDLLSRFKLPLPPKPAYSTYDSVGIIDKSLLPFYALSGECFGEYGRFAQTTGQNSLPLYKNAGDTSPLSAIESSIPVEMLQSRDILENSRPIPWYQVRTEEGVQGWIKGPHFVSIEPHATIGGQVEILPLGQLDNHSRIVGKKSVKLFAEPNIERVYYNAIASGRKGQLLEEGEHFSVSIPDENQELEIDWYKIMLDDGTVGWLPEPYPDPNDKSVAWDIFNPLPWKTPLLIATSTPIPQMTQEATSTVAPQATQVEIKRGDCAGQNVSRLAPGMLAKSLATLPLYDQYGVSEPIEEYTIVPIGKKIATIPEGQTFAVLDGPYCPRPSQGGIWWKVFYQEQAGWIVEAAEVDYFVEPLTSASTSTPSSTPSLTMGQVAMYKAEMAGGSSDFDIHDNPDARYSCKQLNEKIQAFNGIVITPGSIYVPSAQKYLDGYVIFYDQETIWAFNIDDATKSCPDIKFIVRNG